MLNLFKVNNRVTRTTWRLSGVIMGNFEKIHKFFCFHQLWTGECWYGTWYNTYLIMFITVILYMLLNEFRPLNGLTNGSSLLDFLETELITLVEEQETKCLKKWHLKFMLFLKNITKSQWNMEFRYWSELNLIADGFGSVGLKE